MSLFSHGVRRLAVPTALLAGTLLLSTMIVSDPAMVAGLPGRVGPTAWPKVMLFAVGLCAALWMVKEIVSMRLVPPRDRADAAEDEGYDNRRAMIGLGMVVLYGALLPVVGFAFATLGFVALWCVIGGIRRPLTVALVTGIGTVVLLYVFVLLAQMPLDRGHGVFDGVTVGLYRLLGIY